MTHVTRRSTSPTRTPARCALLPPVCRVRLPPAFRARLPPALRARLRARTRCSLTGNLRRRSPADSNQNESAMLAFAEADLAAAAAPAARALRPWIIVAVHRPLYSSFNSTEEQAAMRNALAEVLERHSVDVVLSGHVHSYERTWPVTGNYTTVSNASVAHSYVNAPHPVHVITGAAGNGESVDPFTGESYAWSFSAFRSLDHGYTRMTINETHLAADFFSVDQMAVIDSFVLAKDATRRAA
jgi:3',5'-cyclic AMP phosphodiesterase CpdA